jgi:hypothetical protein
MMLADAEDVEPDLVGQLDLLEQVAQTLLGSYRLVGELCKGVDAKLDDSKLTVTDAAALLPPLLALHKAVLAAERRGQERVHGRLSSAEFLQIVSDPLRYGWLQPLNELILALEEDGEDRLPDAELLDRARELLAPPKEKTPFGRRYLALMQREPGLVLAQGDVAKLLRD